MEASSKTAPAGQASALWMSTIAFTACFAVWTIFSIIGIQIKKELGLNETEFGGFTCSRSPAFSSASSPWSR
jgi:NNP family nitrate/nitrite transporter-like MFS transporter